MAIRTLLTVEDVAGFLAQYSALEPGPFQLSGVERGTVNSSYEVGTPDARLFLRLYEEQDFDGAAAEARQLAHLAARGVSTPAPLPRKDGGFVGVLAGKPAALFPWRSGEMRCLRAVSGADGLRVGQALARLHLSGLDAPRDRGRFEVQDLCERLDRIARAPYPALATQAEPLRARLRAWADRRDPSLPRGLIHGDLFRDNVLWKDDGEIAALLDFESASDGVLAYDLMVTVLAWSFKDALDPEIARSIARGYETLRPLSPSEKRGLVAEGAVTALRFTITRITDDALRALETGRAPRPDKDYRRFLRRLECVESLGEEGVIGVLFP